MSRSLKRSTEFLFGFIEFQPEKDRIRFLHDSLFVIFRRIMYTSLLSGLSVSRDEFELEFHPVSEADDAMWVVIAFGRGRPSQGGRGGMFPEATVIIGNVQPDLSVRVLYGTVSVGDGEVRGILRFRLGTTTPSGSLVLPGLQISPDLQVYRSGSRDATADLQGFWITGRDFFPVRGFSVQMGEEVVRLHPGGGHDGYLVAADPGNDRAIWAVPDQPSGLSGHLEVVRISSGTVEERISPIRLDLVAFTADGRWAAVMDPKREGSRRGELIVGVRSAFRIVDGIMVPRKIIGALPIRGSRWAMIHPDGAVLLNGMEVEGHERIPVERFAIAAASIDAGVKIVDGPDREPEFRAFLDEFRGTGDRLLTRNIRFRGRLGYMFSPGGDAVVFLPSFRILRFRQSTAVVFISIGDGGYAVVKSADDAHTGSAVVSFFDAEGMELRSVRIDDPPLHRIYETIFVNGFHVLLALTGPVERSTFHLITLSERGEIIDRVRFETPASSFTVSGPYSSRDSGTGWFWLKIRSSTGRLMTCVMVYGDGQITVNVTV